LSSLFNLNTDQIGRLEGYKNKEPAYKPVLYFLLLCIFRKGSVKIMKGDGSFHNYLLFNVEMN